MRAHHKRNLWFGEPDLSCRFHIGQGWLPFHAGWSLSPLSGICCSAPKICLSVPELFLARDWQTGENTCHFSLKPRQLLGFGLALYCSTTAHKRVVGGRQRPQRKERQAPGTRRS